MEFSGVKYNGKANRAPPPVVEKLEIPAQNDAVEPPGEEISTPIVDVSYSVKEICECWVVQERIRNEWKKKVCGYEDSTIMKEHIRLWAYAVASTVR
ncbi:hypothetical protein SDJN02_25242, partial [Cucurbita argyrosperma subsp. argyrosperma]